LKFTPREHSGTCKKSKPYVCPQERNAPAIKVNLQRDRKKLETALNKIPPSGEKKKILGKKIWEKLFLQPPRKAFNKVRAFLG